MKRVEADALWSLFDPRLVPRLVDTYGEDFEALYEKAEEEGLYRRQVPARELYGLMLKTLAQTGNGWMTFKDTCNLKSNQTFNKANVIHLSNLCTEILEVTNSTETAVCNLGSINASQYLINKQFDFDLLAKNVKKIVKYLDRVVDVNFYPIRQANASNLKWRPIGLGLMGLQTLFFKMKLAFDEPQARELSQKIQEEIYYNALLASADLAEKEGAHPTFADTYAAQGILQFDMWKVTPTNPLRWEQLKAKIKKTGLRNSLMIAIAPTATIASITGATECIEPQVSNLFKRETLSGEFLQINPFLISDLRDLNLWDEEMRKKIKMGEGSILGIPEIPERLKEIYRTVWEIPQRSLIDMAADRGPFIDQSQSLNLFLETPTIGKLSSMYQYAWKKGLKTCYYMRSRAATRIAKVGSVDTTAESLSKAVACSLENPEACESCT